MIHHIMDDLISILGALFWPLQSRAKFDIFLLVPPSSPPIRSVTLMRAYSGS